MNQAVAQDSPTGDLAPQDMAGGEVLAFPDDEKRGKDIEQTRQELIKKLQSYTPVKDTTQIVPDRLLDRYTIHCSQPLSQYSYGNVRAYAVTDDKSNDIRLYAAVCDPSRPYRLRALKALENYEHPHLMRVVAHGIAKISSLNECRYVIIFEQPEGRPLSQLLAEGHQYNERSFSDQILNPVVQVLSAFEGMGINHCRIGPDNIFVGEKVILGECICEPSSFTRNYFYEPIERLLTLPQGAGGGTTKVDAYNLGALTVECLFSFKRLAELNKDSYTGLLLAQGSYNVLTVGNSFSDSLADLLIGTLCDNPEERWSCAQLNLWLGGKRFNLLKPSPPREASRPFEFDGEQFFSTRALAQNFYVKWENARGFVRDAKIDRWMEQGVHRRDAADVIRRAINSTGGPDSKNPRQNGELLARIISVLDPTGPLRLEHLSFSPGGLGLLISDAMRGKKQKELALVKDILDFDLLTFWSERQAGSISEEASETLWKLQKQRHFLMLKGMGFGMERLMYDLNPHLPCLSPSLMSYHISTLPDMLYALDALAKNKGEDTSLVDRHLAAFVASHAAILKEVAIKDLRHHAHLLQSPEILVLVLLAKAQEKAGIKQLKGLSYWAALRMLDMVRNIHSVQTRRQVCRDIATAAEHGHVGYVLQALLNMKVLNGDLAGFEKAQKTFQVNRARINDLKNREKTRGKAEATGITIASVVSMMILAGALFSTVGMFI